MNSSDILADGFGRVREVVHNLGGAVSADALLYRPDPDANTIAWLLWHTARVIDSQVAEVAGREQVWTADGWAARFAFPFDPSATGYGQNAHEVGQVQAGIDDLVGYYDAVHEMVIEYVGGVDEQELDRIVDERWTPPVSAGVRLVSCIEDGLQHVGQASYVLGLAERQR
ncbi:DUF664 domain-containing protein [soil metagenome]